MSQKHFYSSQIEQGSTEQYKTPLKKQAQTQMAEEQTLQKKANYQNKQVPSTIRPQRKIVLYDENNQKHFFPLYRDKDIGIGKEYQEMLIDSWNDDDKRTSSTQMRRGMHQTMEDLKDVFGDGSSSQTSSGY